MQEYMKGIKDKKVALFATLGGYPDSDHAVKVIENARELIEASNDYIGSFICQGKIDPELTERSKQYPPDEKKFNYCIVFGICITL